MFDVYQIGQIIPNVYVLSNETIYCHPLKSVFLLSPLALIRFAYLHSLPSISVIDHGIEGKDIPIKKL
jgi:hypothetical protein